MKSLKIAASRACPDCFTTQRELVDVRASDYIDVAAIVLAVTDIASGILDEIEATGFGIPVFVSFTFSFEKKGLYLYITFLYCIDSSIWSFLGIFVSGCSVCTFFIQ